MRKWTAEDLAALKKRDSANMMFALQVRDKFQKIYDAQTIDSEKVLQVAVEAMLGRRGYLRMTPDNYAACGEQVRGFFGHWPRCKGNPTISDLLIVDVKRVRPPLMLELKVRDEWQPGQKEAVALGLWVVAWSVKEAEGILDGWEGKIIEQKETKETKGKA